MRSDRQIYTTENIFIVHADDMAAIGKRERASAFLHSLSQHLVLNIKGSIEQDPWKMCLGFEYKRTDNMFLLQGATGKCVK